VETDRWTAFRLHFKPVPASSRSSLAGGLLLAAG
jgi:hypothetical protein